MAETGSHIRQEYDEKESSIKVVKIIAMVTAFIMIFMICFIISYTFIANVSSKKGRPVAEIPPDKAIAVSIPMGSSTSAIADILKKEDIINSTLLFRIYSNVSGYDGGYKSGTHLVSKGLEYDELMNILISNPKGVKVTIPEGYSIKQIVQKLADSNLVDPAKFVDAVNNADFDYKFVNEIPSRENRLEGYLFPDTYEFDLKAGENEIIRRMLTNFDEKFPARYYDHAKQLGLTADEVIILASVVEKEARTAEDRPRIAGVFLNRLSGKYNISKKLESCATVQYIYTQKFNEVKTVITNEDTKIDDPYNTYLYEGLPPGPICNPGQASIDAVLNAVRGDYLYFVAKGDGTHYFSKTLAEHQAAMVRYGVQ